jgi:hypothetical protein
MSNLKDFLGGLDPDVWTDTKAGYLDANVSSRAAASTALTNATWTDAKAGQIDANISSRAPSSTALSTAQWTNTRAGNLDNLDAPISGVGGLSSSTWTNTKAGYLDASISSRAPSSTALSSNVWTTTYRNRIDTTVSSRLSTCSVQHLNSRNYTNSTNDYDTWSISSVNTNQAFLTQSSSLSMAWGVSRELYSTHARFVNGTNVRYGVQRINHYGYTPAWENPYDSYKLNNNQIYFSLHCVRIN